MDIIDILPALNDGVLRANRIKIKISPEVFAVLQSKKWPHETQRNAVERAIMQLENIKFGE